MVGDDSLFQSSTSRLIYHVLPNSKFATVVLCDQLRFSEASWASKSLIEGIDPGKDLRI